MNSRAEIARDLHAAITEAEAEATFIKFRLQALRMLLTQYEGDDGMTMNTEDEARPTGFAYREDMARKAWEFFTGSDERMSHDFRGGYHQGFIDGAAYRVSTTPSERRVQQAQWEDQLRREAPTLTQDDGEEP